ncbi:MAG: hypothetical protein K2W95_13580 [Candidatus Obscuribacterales bacterium]|nr:hypothetical protein [Candidatus Obscuribacterales bacterium]
MDEPDKDKDCLADGPDPRTEDLWKPGDVPMSTQLQDQSILMQNWTRNEERLAVDFPWTKIGGPAGSKVDSGEDSNEVLVMRRPRRGAHEDMNAMNKPSVKDAPDDRNADTPAQKNELKAYDARRGPTNEGDRSAVDERKPVEKPTFREVLPGVADVPPAQESMLARPSHRLITPLNRNGAPSVVADEQRPLKPEPTEVDLTVKERSSEAPPPLEPPSLEPSMDMDGRPSDRTFWPGDAMPRKIDYEALAKQIIDSGRIPEAIRIALENGAGHPGLDLDELNKILGPQGLFIAKTAMKTGLRATLYQNGEESDSVVAKTPAAKEAAQAMLSEDRTEISKECSVLANRMIDEGLRPQIINKALENGVGKLGNDFEELNKILGPKGFYFQLEPSKDGWRANLHRNGEIKMSASEETSEGRNIAEKLLSATPKQSTGKTDDSDGTAKLPPAIRKTPPGVFGSVPSSHVRPMPADHFLPGGNVPILDRNSIVKALALGAEGVNSALYRESKIGKALVVGTIGALEGFN